MKEIKPNEITRNPFDMIGKDWMLITAEKDGVVNTMTASWGGVGVLWNKNVVYIFVRPQRYTKEFIDATDTFSLSFFDESYRKDLTHLGRVSGRDENKITNTQLHVTHIDNVPAFNEASRTMICKKLYAQYLTPESFIDSSLDAQNYPNKDYHMMYVGEILKVIE